MKMIANSKSTIHDVAKSAGVSITTVSLILNNKKSSFSPQTIERVRACAQECNYSPSPIAASMITKKTKTIGYIIPDIQNMFFSQIAKNVEMEINKWGYNLILCNSDDRFDRDLQAIKSLTRRSIDLLVIAPSSESLKKENIEEFYRVLSNLNNPYIIVDRDLGEKTCNKIVNDNEHGGYLATKHLLEYGHRRIACISGPLEVSSAKYRYLGYVKALQEAGLHVEDSLVYEGDYYFESGYEIANRILKDKEITAVFASNDLMAYGVFKACHEANVKIPEELSIIGFDDLYYSQILDIPLTTIKQDIQSISSRICDFIVSHLNPKSEMTTNQMINEMIQPSLSIRSSVFRRKGS